MIYIDNRDTRCDYNLALEQYVFECMPKDKDYFILWRNSPTVVVGRYQNTVEEVNSSFLKENEIRVVRRLTGGGAVYHDLGNINYTYITNGDVNFGINLKQFCEPLLETLKDMGIPAELSGRNDIHVNGKKVSGNAQCIKKGRIMHHGTLLYNSDLSALSKALCVSQDKIQSKAIKSTRSRVANIIEYMKAPVSTEEFLQILQKKMCEGKNMEWRKLTREDREKIEKIRVERYGTWEWNWGNSPNYMIEKKRSVEGCGNIQIYMNVEEGKITECQLRGDFFGEKILEELEQMLTGCQLKKENLLEKLETINVDKYILGLSKEQFIGILLH